MVLSNFITSYQVFTEIGDRLFLLPVAPKGEQAVMCMLIPAVEFYLDLTVK